MGKAGRPGTGRGYGRTTRPPSGTKGRSPGQRPAEPSSQADPGAETTCILEGAGRRLPSAGERQTVPLALVP